MNSSEIVLRKAKRTKEGFQVSFDFDGDIFVNVKMQRPLHPDLVAALAACGKDVAYFDERASSDQRPVTCSGIVVVYQGDNIGISYTGTQQYARAGQTQGFATPTYWYDGEKQKMNADQKDRADLLISELCCYIAKEKMGAGAQRDMFESDEMPDAGQPIAEEKVKGRIEPAGNKRLPAITSDAKEKACSVAGQILRRKVDFEELETTWQQESNFYTVTYEKTNLLGYIKIDAQKIGSIFTPSQSAIMRLKATPDSQILVGDSATAAAKDAKVRRPTKIINQLTLGSVAMHGKSPIVVSHCGFDKETGEWVVVGNHCQTKKETILPIDKNLVISPSLQAISEATGEKDEVKFDGVNADTAEKTASVYEAAYTSIRDAWNGGECDEPERVEETCGKTLAQVRAFHDKVGGSVEAGMMSTHAGERVCERLLDVIRHLDSLHAEIFETTGGPGEADEFEDEFAAAASNG